MEELRAAVAVIVFDMVELANEVSTSLAFFISTSAHYTIRSKTLSIFGWKHCGKVHLILLKPLDSVDPTEIPCLSSSYLGRVRIS